MKRRLLSLVTLVALTATSLAFGMFGSATSAVLGGLARASGVSVELVAAGSATSLIAPIPSVTADKNDPEAEQALVRIADQPAGPASLIDEIAALYVTARFDAEAETALATSDTGRVALLETPEVAAAASLPGLGLGDVLGLIGSGGAVATPAVISSPSIVADALHGIVRLSCPQLELLRSKSSLQRLQAITEGSLAQQVKIKPLLGLDTTNADLPIVGNINRLNDNDFDRVVGDTERASAYSLRLPLPAIGILGIAEGTRLLEINLYEVNAQGLNSATLQDGTLRASVDMLHVTVLDKITGLPEIDIRVGHAESSLIGCPGHIDVTVGKSITAIAGRPVTATSSLVATPGNTVDYRVVLKNNSKNGCTISQVVDLLPAGFELVSSSGGFGSSNYDPATGTIVWGALDLSPSHEAQQTVRTKIGPKTKAGTYRNLATASGSCGSFQGFSPPIQVIVVLGLAPSGPGRTKNPGRIKNAKKNTGLSCPAEAYKTSRACVEGIQLARTGVATSNVALGAVALLGLGLVARRLSWLSVPRRPSMKRQSLG